ncbi:MAG TPA: hypothetical protein VLN49_19235 [Gemmatimonadaceae bacterium]|nr:hypothetical protein [Gemmatimonadaceae bacterium]
MPVTIAAQSPADSLNTSPDPVLGIPLGGSRSAVWAFLSSHGWTRTVDSIASAVGKPSLFSGTIDGHAAEVVAMFSDQRDRMINLVINVRASSPTELASAYAWAYRRMERLRCPASLPAEYRVQLDSILADKAVGIPDRSRVPVPRPEAEGHSSVDTDGNTDWPMPSWLTADGALGTRLSASVLAAESAWPYEVSIWTATAFTIIGDPTVCPDTRAAAKQRNTRALRPAAPGEKVPLDTLTILAGPGVRGRVGTQSIRTRDLVEDSARVFTIVSARGNKVPYTVAADTGFEDLIVVLDVDSVGAKGTITVAGNQVLIVGANRAITLSSANRKLYELLRAQLTASDPLSAVVDVECETERLTTAFPDSAARLIESAQRRAVDPARDSKALRRIDQAAGGHLFAGCVEDRKAYQKKH